MLGHWQKLKPITSKLLTFYLRVALYICLWSLLNESYSQTYKQVNAIYRFLMDIFLDSYNGALTLDV